MASKKKPNNESKSDTSKKDDSNKSGNSNSNTSSNPDQNVNTDDEDIDADVDLELLTKFLDDDTTPPKSKATKGTQTIDDHSNSDSSDDNPPVDDDPTSPKSKDTEETETNDDHANSDSSDDNPPVFFPVTPPLSSSSIEDTDNPLAAYFAEILESTRNSTDAMVNDIMSTYTRHSTVRPHELLNSLFRYSNQERDPMFLPWQDQGPDENWPDDPNYQWIFDVTTPPPPQDPFTTAEHLSTILAVGIIILLILNRFVPDPPEI